MNSQPGRLRYGGDTEIQNIQHSTFNIQLRTGLLLLVLFVALTCKVRAGVGEEEQLITTLRSGASQVEREDACRRLKQIGTVRAVPVLAELLRDPHLFQHAADALETMPFKEVDKALREALKDLAGTNRVGLVHVIGERRDVEAVKSLKGLLEDKDPALGAAAARALGNIGGKDACKALLKAKKSAHDPVRAAVVDGLLQCATRLLAEGENSEAASLFKQLEVATEAEQVRVAAYAGWLRTGGKRALPDMVSALAGGDRAREAAALMVAREIPGEMATKLVTNLLVLVGPAKQIALLGVLQQRGDVLASPAVVVAAGSPDSSVRLAALAALGTIGDASAIPLLAEAAAGELKPRMDTDGHGFLNLESQRTNIQHSTFNAQHPVTDPAREDSRPTSEAEQKVARGALIELHHGNVAEGMVWDLKGVSPAAQAELIRVLTVRNERSAVPKLLEVARTGTGPTRRAALRGLEQLATGADLPALVPLLVAAPDEAAQAGVRRVFESIADRASAGQKVDVTPIVTAYSQADESGRIALLGVCGFFPEARLRAAVRAAHKDPAPDIQAGAARAIVATRDTELLPDLLELARSSNTFGTAAFDQYVRLIADEGNGIFGARRLQLLRPAYELAKAKEQKWAVLGALAGAAHLEALDLANRARADVATRAEAELACTKIARLLLDSEPTAAKTVLRQLAADGSGPAVRTNALAILKQYDSGWVYAGPYRMPGKQCRELFDMELGPEKAGAEGITWRRAGGSADLARPGEVELAPVVGGDHCAVYLRSRVFVPQAQGVGLEIGSDDGIKLWVNGELVHANNAVRGLAPGQDRARANLRAGWNDLRAKITQSTAGCGMMLRVTGADGAEVNRFDARGGFFEPAKSGFTRVQLEDKFYAEGAAYGDFNRDGAVDVVAGPFWFAGPDFKGRHEFRAPKVYDPLGYSDSFLYFNHDFNGDGWLDIFCVPFPGAEGFWYENPQGTNGLWARHAAYPMIGNESPTLCDLTGDGRPELVFNNEGFLGYATYDPAKPNEVWKFHAISPKDGRFQRFTHGLGVGDLNGDGRKDVIEAAGWWEQPADLAGAWRFHPQRFAEAASQMLVTDVDGDGLPDIINAWHCHRYGLVWHRQIRAASGEIGWEQHVVMAPTPDLRVDEVRFSELHAMDLVDMNGDGQPDVVTGKRFWAHGPVGDVEPDAPAVLCWYEFRRDGKGGAEFVPHFIDDDSGVGTQVVAGDLNGDKRPDVVVGNKKGIFLHLTKSVNQ